MQSLWWHFLLNHDFWRMHCMVIRTLCEGSVVLIRGWVEEVNTRTQYNKTILMFPRSALFCQELRKYKENEKDTEVLMSALSAMQDKTQHLENSLSAETRIKLDLFSALGDAKRQLEIAQGICFAPSSTSWDSLCSHNLLHSHSCCYLTRSVCRSDLAEGSGDQGAEAKDSRSHGRHAQHRVFVRLQQHAPYFTSLLLKVYGHESIQPGPQRVRLPATSKMTLWSIFWSVFGFSELISKLFFFFKPQRSFRLQEKKESF